MSNLLSFIKETVNPTYEKEIALFESMGFETDKAEDYLKKYNGNKEITLQVSSDTIHCIQNQYNTEKQTQSKLETARRQKGRK